MALILAPGSSAAQSPLNDSTQVRTLRFEGNATFSSSALRSAIETDDTGCRSFVLYPFCWLGGDWAIDRHFLDRSELARDIARLRLFYFRRGFREARADTLVTEAGEDVEVTFRVDEGRPVLVSAVSLVDGAPPVEGLDAADLPLRPGEPLSLLQLEASRDQLLGALGDNGFAHAEVLAGFDIPAGDPYTARVYFEPLPGSLSRYGDITVLGNDDLTESTVRSIMPLEEGDLYSDAQISVAQRNLFELDIVRHVEILTDLGHRPDSVVPLEVRINEAGPHRIEVGGGFSTFRCLNLDTSWTSRNFRGGGRTLQLTGQVWNGLADELASTVCTQAGTGRYGLLNYRVAANFLQPVIFSPRNAFSTRLFLERESFPDVFVRQTVGTDLTFSRNIGRLSATAVTYKPQYGSFDAAEVYFCSNFLICSSEEIDVISAPNMLAPIGVQLSTDQTIPFTNPVRGWAGLVAFEHAGTFTFSDYSYDRLILEGSLYEELGRGSQRVIATRLRTGLLFPETFGGVSTDATDLVISSPSKRFYMGGATTVRGFAAGRLGPRSLQTDVRNLVAAPEATEPGICAAEEVLDLSCDANPLGSNRFTDAPTGGNLLLLGNVEYRAWLTEKLQGSLFLDFGQVWTESSDFELADLEFTPGFGIRYPTPIGPLRLDLAYNFRTSEALPTLTAQLEPFDPANPKEVVTIGQDGTQYVISDALAPLEPLVDFGSDNLWSFNRFQLHLSVGQAF